MDDKYIYFVSYSYNGNSRTADIHLDKPIPDFTQTVEIGNYLARVHDWPIGSVTVLNIELKRSPDRQEAFR